MAPPLPPLSSSSPASPLPTHPSWCSKGLTGPAAFLLVYEVTTTSGLFCRALVHCPWSRQGANRRPDHKRVGGKKRKKNTIVDL
uniref:Uncharacterized protein n=1 Tax=Oryza sativa subsp. japonica TaxID=39947 RepID=Q6YYA8_ORYSJ|nr:hypothetical protein [Oryza sativa Japonica Group]BAD03810.1 hypothetical protein [Oryza sativa Japonica Group]